MVYLVAQPVQTSTYMQPQQHQQQFPSQMFNAPSPIFASFQQVAGSPLLLQQSSNVNSHGPTQGMSILQQQPVSPYTTISPHECIFIVVMPEAIRGGAVEMITQQMNQGQQQQNPQQLQAEPQQPANLPDDSLMYQARPRDRQSTPFPREQMVLGYPAPSGHIIATYDSELTKHYQLPSEDIVVTVGAMRYAEHYNEYGRYSRRRFQLCDQFASGKCTKGSQCTYIHASRLPPDGAPNMSTIHLLEYDGEGAAARMAKGRRYPMMPDGIIFSCPHPNMKGAIFDVPSALVLQTVGAEAAWLRAKGQVNVDGARSSGASADAVALLASGAPIPHCAHYQFRRLCHSGPNCRNIHSRVPILGPDGVERTPADYNKASGAAP